MRVITPSVFNKFGKQVYKCNTTITRKVGKRNLKSSWTTSFSVNKKSIDTLSDEVRCQINDAQEQIALKSISNASRDIRKKVTEELEKQLTRRYGTPEARLAAREARIAAAAERKNPFKINASQLATLGDGFAESLTPEVITHLSEKVATTYNGAKTVLTAEKDTKHSFPVFITICEKQIPGGKKKKPFIAIGKATVGATNPVSTKYTAEESFFIMSGDNPVRKKKDPAPITGSHKTEYDYGLDTTASRKKPLYTEKDFEAALIESRENARVEMANMMQGLGKSRYSKGQKRDIARIFRRSKAAIVNTKAVAEEILRQKRYSNEVV